MDWARDNAGLSDKDLNTVFRYEEKPATVVRMLAGKKTPEIWSLEGQQEWENWIHNERPHIDESVSGLVLIIAKRTGEPLFGSVKKVNSDDWLDRINAEMPGRYTAHRSLTFESLNGKGRTVDSSPGATNMSGRRSVRTLPFSKQIFRLITRKFYTHRSIARDVSRADIPVFSSATIEMGEPDEQAYPAYVYNCRSANAWEMDLALTATYFPHCGLTFAILFGCPLSVEEEVVRRLSFATAEASHPLLMPGIFAELERSRHVQVVEATIDELETKILELDFQSDREALSDSEVESRNQEKRSAWLDTTYLRNGLISWNTQLVKMSDHVDELESTVFKPTSSEADVINTHDEIGDHVSDASSSELLLCKSLELSNHEDMSCSESKHTTGDGMHEKRLDLHEEHVEKIASSKELQDSPEARGSSIVQHRELINEQMRRVGQKIKHRIQMISDEYNDKIRDCTMRVDGMAMATQWAQGETNVEIAWATNRESKHMRSIALVTMVFLPGTFFASVFSMTFFNWQSSDNSVVSKYIWIYVIVTVFFTLLTIGTWWYFVIYRPSRPRKPKGEDEIPLI